MHDNQSKLALVSATGFLDSAVQGGSAHNRGHSTGNVISVSGNEFSIFTTCHSENTGQDSKQRILIDTIQIITHLFSNILHEVHTARDIIAEITFFPSFSPTDYNHTLFKGLGGSSGNVGLTVIVDNSTVQQTPHSNTGIGSTVLGTESFPDIRVANQRFALLQFILLQVGNPLNHVLKRLRIERLGIKLSVRHSKSFLSLDY